MFGTGMQPKPRIYQQAGIARTYAMARVKPKTLLLGNSRVEGGFDPESEAFPSAVRPVFNGGQAGTFLSAGVPLMQEAIALGELQTVIVGVDFQDFLISRPDAPNNSGGGNNRYFPRLIGDALKSTLTFDATLDSIITIANRGNQHATTMTPFGYNPHREYEVFVMRQGHRALFDETSSDFKARYEGVEPPSFSSPLEHSGFRDLMAIIALAKQHQIRLIVFTHPYHGEWLDTLRSSGFWTSFVEWKRALRDLAATSSVSVYDFAVYNGFTTEPVPELHSTEPMRNYWEAGHYKSTLGDELIHLMKRELRPE